jgi:hypothetical protein
VSYEVLTSWRLRLRRKSVNSELKPQRIENARESEVITVK